MTHAYALHDTLIRLDGVAATRGGRPVLRDVSVEIKDIVRPDVADQGQVIAVLGPSGAGKTTLFRILAGLDPPSAGKVEIDGTPARPGRVGVVFQHYPLLEHRRVIGNLRVAGATAAEARAWLARFGLEDRADAWPSELSGGQRQRVAILQQLACGHTYLLMDEPFSGLDPQSKRQAGALINEVARLAERNTVLVVTHDIREAVKVSDTLWLLGKEHDAEGSTIVETYNLIERELAWEPEIERTPRFAAFVRELEDRFCTL